MIPIPQRLPNYDGAARISAINAQLLVLAQIEFQEFIIGQKETDPKALRMAAINIFKKYGIPTDILESHDIA